MQGKCWYMSSIAPQCYDCSCYMKACLSKQQPHTQLAISCFALLTYKSMGIHHVNPVSIQQAVNAKQWPHLVGGCNSPIKSIQMKSIGDMEGQKSFLLNFTFSNLCSVHTGQSLQCCWTFSLMFFQ